MEVSPNSFESLARDENLCVRKLKRLISRCRVVVMGRGNCSLVAVGEHLRTKVNANIGTSPGACDLELELQKSRVARKFGADTISDCSTAGNIDAFRRKLVSSSGVPVTTIPIYQVVASVKSFDDITDELILATLEKQVADGVSSIVIHAGFDAKSLRLLKKQRRIMGMVSKGGSMTAATSLCQKRENPLLALFDDIIEILRGTGVVLNLGNAMRSGCVFDFSDKVQKQEIVNNARLAKRADRLGVPVIIESLGGHANARQLGKWVKVHKKITSRRPLFVAGPLPTEIGLGHDHVAAAIGGAIAAGFGADYLCAITPSEHIGLPSLENIRDGVVSAKIAAHVGDSMKYGIRTHFERDRAIADFRMKRDWTRQLDHVLDKERADQLRSLSSSEHTCSMCGKYCALGIMEKYLFGAF
ncbi:MAG: phosphomethylpyrimidine synthase ThiC [Promethearchaeota archaeon]